jgi:uncharacterized membrane protein (GlpM family)
MDIVLKSIASGITVGIILTVLKFFGPKIAGIFAGIPLVFAISFALVAISNPEKSSLQNFIWGGVIAIIPTLFFYAILSFLTNKAPEKWAINLGITYFLVILFIVAITFFLAKK